MGVQQLDFADIDSLAYVLGAIKNNPYSLYDNRGGLNNVPSRDEQLAALDYLSAQKALTYVVAEKSIPHRDDNGNVIFIVTPCQIELLDKAILATTRTLVEEVRLLQNQQRPTTLSYSPETGEGVADGRRFSLIAKTEKPFFDLLIQNIGKQTHKKNLARTVYLSDQLSSSDKLVINTCVTNLRKITGMSTYQIVQKSDFVTLNAIIQQNT